MTKDKTNRQTNAEAMKTVRIGRETSYLLSPFKCRGMELANRVVLPPMDMYSADENGLANEIHFVHYAARAIGAVGLIIMEATAVAPEGRISDSCIGLWNDRQAEALKPIVHACQKFGSKVAVQLNHAGRKCAAKAEKTILAPSALRFSDDYLEPAAMTKEDIERVVNDFRAAAKRAAGLGFDALEIHGAHGYLISEFLSPLTNRRTDEYSVEGENQVRFLREVLSAVKGVWPEDRPLLLRVSATDHLPGGMTPDGMVKVINQVKDLVDIVHVSSGGVAVAPIELYPGYQVGLSEKIRTECGVPTITVGLITDGRMVEEILGNGRADLVSLGRELFRNPNFVLQYARERGVDYAWPSFYKEAFQAR